MQRRAWNQAKIPTAMMSAGLALGLTLAGCGSSPPPAAGTLRVADPAAPTTEATPTSSSGPLVLAQFDEGVGAVTAGAATPAWIDAAAVAALDGSAVFAVHHDASPGDSSDRLVRLDPSTGTETAAWPLPRGAVSISAVAPKGRWIALTDHQTGYGYGAAPAPASTDLIVFDPATGSETHRLEVTGDVQPEAFSVDGTNVFALDHRGDHYRVQTITLANGERYDTSNRDKTLEREDMRGSTVRGVLNHDHTLLATLYRNPGDDDEPAFVHILDLEHAWAYCADLPQPFGTGPPGSDLIELTPADTVIVAATNASRIAEIHIDEVHEPITTPVTVKFRDGTVPSSGAEYSSTPGFGHVITTLG